MNSHRWSLHWAESLVLEVSPTISISMQCRMATENIGLYADSLQNGAAAKPAGSFDSGSLHDDLAWAAAWMHRLTGNTSYMQQAAVAYARHMQVSLFFRMAPSASASPI